MSGPHPSVAAVRSAVRETLTGTEIGSRVWVAVSGGPDSLALAEATAYVSRKLGFVAGAIIVDHGLQPGSAEVAARAAKECAKAGLYFVHVETVTVGREGGLEAAARDARYRAIQHRVEEEGGLNPVILTGHTMDDQAETVLLALARGSGARALSGIPPRRGNIIRPLLTVRRKDTVAACEALGLTVWNDPTNEPKGGPTRSDVRGTVIPALTSVLGEGVIAGLARSAALLQADADELDRQSRTALTSENKDAWDCERLSAMPDAIRSRMLKMLTEGAGAGPLTGIHVSELDKLVMKYRGQGAVFLPGGYEVRREHGRLRMSEATYPTLSPDPEANSRDL